MSLISCPECGARISEHAKQCPHCGFCSEDEHGIIPLGALPPEKQQTVIEIPKAAIFDNGSYPIAKRENVVLVTLFKNADKVREIAPSLYDAVQEIMAKRGTVWAADFSEAAEKLMQSGELILGVDKTGKFLPQLRDKDTKRIYEIARLREQKIPSNAAASLATLQLQVTMAELMGEIKDVAASIEALRLEAQGDRIGRAKAVWQRLNQAICIEDSRLREQKVLSIADSATDQRCVMQEHFKNQLKLASSEKKADARGKAARSAINDLAIIALMARTEYSSYSLIGEENSAKAALSQFEQFILENKLNDRDTMLKINGKAKGDFEHAALGFYHMATSITNLSLDAPKSETKELPETREDTEQND